MGTAANASHTVAKNIIILLCASTAEWARLAGPCSGGVGVTAPPSFGAAIPCSALGPRPDAKKLLMLAVDTSMLRSISMRRTAARVFARDPGPRVGDLAFFYAVL